VKPRVLLHRLSPAIFALLLAQTGCGKAAPPLTGAAAVQQALIDRGKMVYLTNCTACHNSDPKNAGALGPEVYGSSEELLHSRIMTGNYPANYKPKRASGVMRSLPHLQNDIKALHAFLNAR